MLRRIRRRFGRFLPSRWFFGFSSILVIILIVRRFKTKGFHFADILTRTSTSKEWETTRNIAPSLPAGNAGRGKERERSRSAIEENGSRQHLLKTTKWLHAIETAGNGSVNVHIWRELCCSKVNSLRQYPLFPTLPKERLLRHTINSGPLGTWYGQRIMGFIHPPHTGYYTFHLDAHVYAELWLSRKSNAMDVELVAKIAKENKKTSVARLVSHTSNKRYLEKGKKYFFDVLHVMNGGMMQRDHVNVTWRIPGSQIYTEISKQFLSPLLIDEPSFSSHKAMTERNDLLRAPRSVIDTELNDVDGGYDDEDYDGMVSPQKQNKLSDKFLTYFGEDLDLENPHNIIEFEQLPDKSDGILSVFPSCSYKPTYAKKQTFKRFEGIWQTHFSSLFPDDGTREFICIGNKQRKDCNGNEFLTESEVLELVQIFMKKIDEKYPR